MATLLAIAPVSSCHHDWLLAVSCDNDCLWQLYWLLPLSVTVAMADYWQSLSQWLPMATLLAIAPVNGYRHDWLLAVPVTMTAYGNFIGYIAPVSNSRHDWLLAALSETVTMTVSHNFVGYCLLPVAAAVTTDWQFLSQLLPMKTFLIFLI